MKLLFNQLEKIAAITETFLKKIFYLFKDGFITITVLNQDRSCYIKFGSNPDSSDFILKDSTKIPSAEKYVGSYDRQ